MTALIAAMNKRLVALAADSAITITSNGSHKVINSANKLMPLSKFHPVGIMFCGNATYMDTPWEVLVKEYRHQRLNKGFDTLEEYKDDFINFLIENNHFTSEQFQINKIQLEAIRLYGILIEKCKDKTIEEGKKIFEKELLDILNDGAEEKLIGSLSNDDLLKSNPDFYNVIFGLPHFKDDLKFQELFKNTFLHFLKRSNSILGSSSIIVISGYGDKDIYPKLRSFEIWIGYKDEIRYSDNLTDEITDINDASLLRFAQTDMINSVVYGIHPMMDSQIKTSMPAFFTKFLEN